MQDSCKILQTARQMSFTYMNVQVLQAYSCKILDTLVRFFLLGIEKTLSGLRKPNRAMLDLMLPGVKAI